MQVRARRARAVMDLDLLHVNPDVDECGDVERDVHLYVNSSIVESRRRFGDEC